MLVEQLESVEQRNNDRRLSELERYDVLDTPAEEAFDRITRLVCRVFGVKMSTVTFIDGHRQWFKSRQGLEASEGPRDVAFCQTPIADGQPLVVPNTLEDPRFADNPLVSGDPALRFYAGVPIRSEQGTAIGTLCALDTAPRTFSPSELELLFDLAKLVETELELRVQATTDGLTGVQTRRAFFIEAERAVALAVRHRYDLSGLIFDIDRFRAINDANGHAVGDLVLRRLAEITRTMLRKSDIFGRLGGEEFAIILPHTGPADALKVAEKLRTTFAAEEIAHGADVVKLTASFGLAALTGGQGDINVLLERADQALFQAKEGGRNRSFLWQGERFEKIGLTRRVLKAGQIAYNGGRTVVDCTVRRLSDIGAQLDVIGAELIPRRFRLAIPVDDFARMCTIVSSTATKLEVTFDDARPSARAG